MGEIRVGISGWTYDGWRGDFYPRGLPRRAELAYVAERMGSVDIDTGIIYTRELTLERIGVVDQVKRVRAAHAVWRPAKVGIETTAYQAALKQILDDVGRREHDYLPVHAIHAVSNKRARIEGSACFYENGTFRLPPLSPAVELQFIEFPKSRHDDAPDVCAMGIELARTINPGAPAECLLPSNGSSRRRHLC